MTEKDFLRAVRDADRSFYARAAAHAAEAEQKKQKGSDFMKRAVRYLLAGSTVLAAAAGVCILTGVFAKPHMDRDYAGVSEIYTERDIMLRAEYENLKMPEQISLKEYTQLYAYTTPEETENEEHPDQERELLLKFAEKMTGSRDPAAVKQFEGPNPFLYYETDREYLDINSAGTRVFYAEKDAYNQLIYYYKGTQIMQYDPERSAVPEEDTVALNGSDWRISDAAAFADQFLAGFLSEYTGFAECQLQTIGIYEMKDGSRQLAMEFAPTVNGIPADDSGDSHGDPFFMVCPKIKLAFSAPEHISLLQCERFFPPSKTQKLSGSFLRLSSAARMLEQFLAPQHTYQVQDVMIRLAAVGEWDQTPYQYRPCYVFVLEEQPGKLQCSDRLTAYVDMQSGKIWMYDMIRGTRDDFSAFQKED